MQLGVTIFATDLSMSPVEVAREAEARGFASLYVPEHTHIPISRRTPPPTGDAVLAEEYLRTLDPYVALAAASSVTRKLRLGTGIALVAQHDPIVLAKTLATLDHLSQGRVVVGIGYGWNEDEMESHGVDPRRRRARVREHMLAIQKLWSEEVASFDGEFVRFAPSWQWPKPVQKPRPAILIGGAAGPILFAQIAEFADGWIPIGGAGVAAALADLHAAAERVGRGPDEFTVIPFGTLPDQGKLDHYATLGITETVLRLPSAGRDEVLRTLDSYAPFLAR
jgi:probable F420-dependent oxidoreductase